MIILLFIGIAVATAIYHLWTLGFPSSIATISEIILLHQFVVTHGIIGILGFYINVLVPEKTAKSLGWPGGPFQIKYGFTQLHVGVMGVLSIWFRGNFWVGTLVTLYFYGLSGLWTHSMMLMKDDKIDKVELTNIILDIIYHVVLTIISLNVVGMWSFN